MGDSKRLMSMRRAQELGFAPRVKLKDGIEKTIDWYINL
jgi:nucleoside-diphosphate-sugar epimerase